jgi:hypothetical protein
MTQSHVVTVFITKRSEIAGQIESFQSEIKRLQTALSNLDGTTKLFAPDVDLRAVKSRVTRKRNQYFIQGEAQRMTLNAMREAGTAVCSREITDILMQRKEITPEPAIAARIQKNILAVLHRLEKKKAVKKIVKDGEPLKWKLV